MLNERRIILASKSPRRKELLSMIGLEYEVIPSEVDEDASETEPSLMVEQLARQKAESVKEGRDGCIVIGSDTIVCLDGEIIGKPRDESDAFGILKRLQGKTHTVYTGLCIISDDQKIVCHDAARVTFAEMSDGEILDYIRTGEPMDKAGAYGIQGVGGVFVKHIEGSYFTVIGLPIHLLYENLGKLGEAQRIWRRRTGEHRNRIT